MAEYKICIISDTHKLHHKVQVPECDFLLHCGDFSFVGDFETTKDFNEWLGKQPAKHKVVICGNHEVELEKNQRMIPDLLSNAEYLQDESIVLDGLKIHGSPRTPMFYNWAFMEEEEDLQEFWDLIEPDVDVLMVHGPPYGIGDKNRDGHHCGSPSLLETVMNHPNLKLVACGHIHEDRSINRIPSSDLVIVNASICNFGYKADNEPVVLTIKK